MKTFACVLVASLLALGACGSKDKKSTTTPAPMGTATGQQTPEPPTTDQTDTGGDANANNPELQQVVYFEFDQADLDAAARAKLEENAEWLKAQADRTLTIEGHTDEVGTTEYNAALGERRARAARDYLVRLGIEEGRVDIITYGEERPASDQDALNRRSVFIATKK